jgi:ubiquinone/menaquinone biosynthesis C-methylase UbiE
VTDPESAEICIGTYSQVAHEYYRPERHPTAANFRQASRMLLERLISEVPPDRSCEVGAGDSLLAELLWRRQGNVEGMLITDLSPSMLEYSRGWDRHGAILHRAAASELPVPDGALLLLAASLADPYDDRSFWEEVVRVLAPGGRCVLTSPSSEWADGFREQGVSRDAAEFELLGGKSVHLRSFVRQPEQERELIESTDLLLIEEDAITLSELEGPISPKIAFLAPDSAVVRGFMVEKPAR